MDGLGSVGRGHWWRRRCGGTAADRSAATARARATATTTAAATATVAMAMTTTAVVPAPAPNAPQSAVVQVVRGHQGGKLVRLANPDLDFGLGKGGPPLLPHVDQ